MEFWGIIWQLHIPAAAAYDDMERSTVVPVDIENPGVLALLLPGSAAQKHGR